MTYEEQAASMKREEIVSLLQAYEELSRRVEWLQRQVFGPKSERRVVDRDTQQLSLEGFPSEQAEQSPETDVAAHRRRRRRDPIDGSADEKALRFDPSVPVKEILVPDPALKDADLSEYEHIGTKVSHRLAQRPGTFVVLRYVREVYKRKADEKFFCPPAPASVLEKSFADVSFLAGLLIDKFTYHLPLYRQHQRLRAAGVKVGRTTLTHLVHRATELLEPIYEAQLRSILSSEVLSMDETPIKAGRQKRPPPKRGKMKTGYFWPIYGDRAELAFPFAPTRGGEVVGEVLKEFEGVLLTDGYKVYDTYAQTVNEIVHAQCWAHVRRHFEQAESAEPELASGALDRIAELYAHEKKLQKMTLSLERILAYRGEHSRAIVDGFYEWLQTTLEAKMLLQSNPFTKAARYAQQREKALRVFLEYPNVAIDTNHLEREIRPIALGRKNWMFCWTEIGAKYVGIVQSLLRTCRLHEVDAYTYLVDVLQRIDDQPAKDVALLTPRLWKETFAENPLPSDIDRVHV
jgi:transposase